MPGLSFSPDGELLVAGYGQGGGGDLLRIWHLGSRELLGSLPYRGRWLFHPDGRRLLFGAPEGGIGVWDRVERRVVRRLPLDFTPQYLALDPEGRRLAVNNADPAAPRVAILELETGRVLADWRSQVGNGAMAWSADGQLLAVGGGGNDPRVYVWNVRRGALASVLQGHTARSSAPSSRTRATCWRPQAGMARPGSGTRPSGEPLVAAPGKLARASRRMTAGWPSRAGREDRRLGRGHRRRVPDAPPRDARQPLRGAGRHRGDPALMSAPTAGWWRPVTGMASGSGRPTRAANWPSSRRVSARPCCFTPTGKA